MKTAISLPDALFRQAEHLAKRLNKNRSELYQEAIAQYVARYDEDEVTRRINEVLAEVGQPDTTSFVRVSSRQVLANTEWEDG
ncbi:MAG: ribbon-helix-helix protein, CopG family [Polyangiaceae bacterium]|nr:ribbon-helix-helix protein, CopG family [Polyangiaceae bacterium]MCW5792276.1 ribbon-helix-helix protein, CopG family [Polyangiaceae bacterium]